MKKKAFIRFGGYLPAGVLAALVIGWTPGSASAQEYGGSSAGGYGGEKEPSVEGTQPTLESFSQALVGGKIKLDMRYRFENVDQDGFDQDAYAHVLRTRLGYLTGHWAGFQVYGEFENLAHLFGDKFNDTVNGGGRRPVVADPDGTELNQAYLDYYDGLIPDTKIRGGRFRWKVDNDRFIGNVGFRQNEQTFDGFWVKNSTIPKTEVTYGYLANANRITGDDSPVGDFHMDSHVGHLKYTRFPFANFSLYNYYLKFSQDGAVKANNTNSTGLRVWGSHPIEAVDNLTLTYAAEFAHQVDISNNPFNIDENYWHINPGVKWGGLTAKFGYEVLGGNDTVGFRTPLATFHAFNGETDQFLVVTPPGGLQDIYGKVSYEFQHDSFLDDITVWGMYHDFEEEEGSTDLGEEFSFAISKRFNDVIPRLGGKAWVEFRFATFDSGKNDPQNRRDVDKLWVTLRYNY